MPSRPIQRIGISVSSELPMPPSSSTRKKSNEPERERVYECTYCLSNSRDDSPHDPILKFYAGRACPFCGEGVVKDVTDA